MSDPVFVKPSDAHPISAHLLSKPRDQYSGLNPITPVIREGATEYAEIAPDVSALTELFAPSITPTEVAWAQGKVPSSAQHAEPAPEKAPPKFKNAYHAIIDQMLIDPTVTVTKLSTLTGYSRTWLHKVMSSDSFQAQLATRQKNLVDDHIRHSVMDRLAGLGSRSLEILEKAMDSDNTPATFALEVLNMTNKAQGIGQQKVNNVQNFIVQVPTPMTNAQEWAAQHSPVQAGAVGAALSGSINSSEIAQVVQPVDMGVADVVEVGDTAEESGAGEAGSGATEG